MSKVYIFGSSGYVGKALNRSLQQNSKIDVVTVGRLNCNILLDLETGDFSELLNKINEGDSFVFLSAISSPDTCNREKDLARLVNVTNTVKLIKQLNSRKVNVIFSSSDVVFGGINGVALDSSPLSPFGEYGIMKAEVEREVSSLPYVKVVRFSFILGEGDKYTSMLIDQSLKSNNVDVFEGFKRNVVIIDDVLLGIKNIIENWKDINVNQINFSGPELIGRDKLTELFARIVCKKLKYTIVNAPDGFWEARPKSIEMKSVVFEDILKRKAMSVKDKIKLWRKS